jgi:hypothetical protein
MMLTPKIKLLQLRKLKHSPGLIIKLDGPLLSKRGLRAKLHTDRVRNQIHQAVDEFKWLAPPRARMAVSFRFFSDQHNPPEIYRLIKYYLDLLQGPVLKDDRQVQYLDASIWRSAPKGEDTSSSLYVYVRRLSAYLRLIDLCKESDVFSETYNAPIIYHHLIERHHWDDAEKQCNLLCCNRIMPYDVPRHNNPFLKEFVCDFNKRHPFVFHLGSLPNRGQSASFTKIIASSLSRLAASYPNFNKILVPIELDVKAPKSGINLAKDLDNIMMTICSEAKKQLLHPRLFINGYRIYVADKLDPGTESGLQVKLLPPGEIESYNDRIKKAIDSLEDALIAERD